MLTVGDKLPAFNVTAVVSQEKGKQIKQIDQDTYKGQWQVLFFWPKDFTFICPTEIAEFGKRYKDFQDRNAQVRRLQKVAKRLEVSLSQLAIAWCAANPNVSTVITGASKPEQVAENMGALDALDRLTPEVKAEIEKITTKTR